MSSPEIMSYTLFIYLFFKNNGIIFTFFNKKKKMQQPNG